MWISYNLLRHCLDVTKMTLEIGGRIDGVILRMLALQVLGHRKYRFKSGYGWRIYEIIHFTLCDSWVEIFNSLLLVSAACCMLGAIGLIITHVVRISECHTFESFSPTKLTKALCFNTHWHKYICQNGWKNDRKAFSSVANHQNNSTY